MHIKAILTSCALLASVAVAAPAPPAVREGALKIGHLDPKQLAGIKLINPALGKALDKQNSFVDLFYLGYDGKGTKVTNPVIHPRDEAPKIPHLDAGQLADIKKINPALADALNKQNSFVDLFYLGYGGLADEVTNPVALKGLEKIKVTPATPKE
ncbi:MAG: hypothetical protein M1833_003747 [Piccolia ochrophora]|nr:MAG: hypothetical protein M1833_003747 [Piccolia ochrophora]